MEEFNGMKCDVGENNVHVLNSYTMTDTDEMLKTLRLIKKEHPECNTFERDMDNLINEWVSHNRLYYCHIARSHTKDMDLNVPQKWYETVIYFILSL